MCAWLLIQLKFGRYAICFSGALITVSTNQSYFVYSTDHFLREDITSLAHLPRTVATQKNFHYFICPLRRSDAPAFL